MVMEIIKKPGITEPKTITNNLNNPNYSKKIHQIQVFRKELPLILERNPLEQRIELLEQMIPKIEVEQMAIFARQLQDAYIAVWYSKKEVSKKGIQKSNS